jgi:hypothetical protein
MRRLALTVPLVALLLTGCGSPSPQPSTSSPADVPQAQQAPASVPATTAASELPLLGVRKTGDRTIPLEVALREVRVGASAMTVTFSVTNRTQNTENWWVNSFFDDGVSQSNDDTVYTADGVTVIDTKGAKRYLPARTAENRCMCSNHLGSAIIGRDQTVFISAVFQAVPADVATVSVDIPHAGIFADIAVTR